MPPKRTTTRSSAKARSETYDDHDDSGEVFDDPDDADDSAVEQTRKATGKKSTISQAVPSVPSELATTQGRTAFDVRYFFNIPEKTCYRCT